MLKTVRAYLNENNAVWGALPAFVAALEDLAAGIDDIDTAHPGPEEAAEDVTTGKATLLEALDDHVREMADAVYAHAIAGPR